MDPLRLQKQLRDNSNDVMSFCADLKQWGEEMKHKDLALKSEDSSVNPEVPLVRNKIKKQPKAKEDASQEKSVPNRKKRIRGIDYAAWDKFDVDAECAKLDTQKSYDSSGELTDECDETVREEAIYQKEKGNKFVKKESWNQAIDCYTKAIECYAYDPVFYANRALCHLKNLDYRLAESDCTTAIQLDKTYVKAYHRRAQAREALNQLNEAHDDLLKIFDYEPDNKESKISLAKLEKKLESSAKEACARNNNAEQRPKSKFTLSRQQQKVVAPTKPQTINKSLNSGGAVAESTNAPYWPSGNNIQLIKTVNKAPHLRSKTPLRRIAVTDTDFITSCQKQVVAQPLPSVTSDNSIIKCDDFKVVERQIEKHNTIENDNKYKKELSTQQKSDNDTFCFDVPTTSVQFNYDWRLLKNNAEWQYLYLKQVHPTKLKKIFNESLECDIFSSVISTLVNMFVDKNIPVYEYLLGLTEVKRFNMLIMFMSDCDKEALKKLVKYMQSDKKHSETDIENIINKYGL